MKERASAWRRARVRILTSCVFAGTVGLLARIPDAVARLGENESGGTSVVPLPMSRPRIPNPPALLITLPIPAWGAASSGTADISSAESDVSQTPAAPPAPDASPPALSGSDLTATPPAQDGTTFSARLTHYGYSHDPYMDSNTRAGIGHSNNSLHVGVVALDPGSQRQFGIRSGDVVSFTFTDGAKIYAYVGDTTAEGLGPRFDLYDPLDNLVGARDGQMGTVTIEARAPAGLTGSALQAEGSRLLEAVQSGQ